MRRHNSFSGRKKIVFQRHFLSRKAISEAKVGMTKEWMFANYAHVELSEHLISFSDFFLMRFSIFITTKTDDIPLQVSTNPSTPSSTMHATPSSVCCGSAVKLGQDRIHFSCVWFLSVVTLRAAIYHDPTVPSNKPPAQSQPFHTLYIKATLMPIN